MSDDRERCRILCEELGIRDVEWVIDNLLIPELDTRKPWVRVNDCIMRKLEHLWDTCPGLFRT